MKDPCGFNIKINPSFTIGAQHVLDTVRKSCYLSENLKKILDPVIQRNAYFAHPENIMLTMLVDDHEFIRELGYCRILKARTSKPESDRQFKIPSLNFEATSYEDLVFWANLNVTELPILAKLTEDELREIVANDLKVKLQCHSNSGTV